ncbi:hypothetical protein [Desulfocurvus sp. DL9XJH121]
MPTDSICRIDIALSRELAAQFASLMQQGFQHPVTGPVAIRDFLTGLPGFSREYIETEVQTIFHNGVATDSLDDLLYAGDTLALSAAMPGLAGAIFRRAGMHASLRATVEEAPHADAERGGFVTVKLYNSIGTDRVVDLMLAGVRLSSSGLASFIKRRGDLFSRPMRILHDGRPVAGDRFPDLVSGYRQTDLSLSIDA